MHHITMKLLTVALNLTCMKIREMHHSKNKKNTYCNGWTGCNWVVHLAGHIGLLEAAHRNQQPEEGKQEGPVAAVGSVAGIPAVDHKLAAGLGNQAAAGYILLAGSSYFGCNLPAGCLHCN